MRLACLLLAAGCARSPPPEAPRQAACLYDVRQSPTLGQRGRVGFGYFPAVSDRLEVPLAAGGARTEILTFSASSVPQVREVLSTDSSVARFDLAAVGGSLCQNQSLLVLRTGLPGRTDLVLLDEAAQEIDRVPVLVEATTRLEIDRGWPEGPARILAGSLQGIHATTLGGERVLVGTGSIRFALEGDLLPFPDRDAAPPWWGGDVMAFTGAPGSGRVMVDCGALHEEIAVEVVASPDEVQITARPGRWPAPVDVVVAARSGGAPLHGAQCQWSWPFDPPEWVAGGWIGSETTTRYRFTAPGAGSYQASCTLPGASPQLVELKFE